MASPSFVSPTPSSSECSTRIHVLAPSSSATCLQSRRRPSRRLISSSSSAESPNLHSRVGYFSGGDLFHTPLPQRRFRHASSHVARPPAFDIVSVVAASKPTESGIASLEIADEVAKGGDTGILVGEADIEVDKPEVKDWLRDVLGSPGTPLSNATFQQWRDEARLAFARKAFSLPNRRTEGWRMTNLRELVLTGFAGGQGPAAGSDLSVEALSTALGWDEGADTRAVFVNGVFNAALSNLTGLPAGVVIGGVDALADLPHSVNLLANGPRWFDARSKTVRDLKYADDTRLPMDRALSTFTALNQACFSDVACVWVPQGVVVDKPLRLIFVATAAGDTATVNHPRCLVLVDPSAQCHIIEEYVSAAQVAGGSAAPPTFTNAVTEVHVADNATVAHSIAHDAADESFAIYTTAITQGRESTYRLASASTGGKLSRHDVDIDLTGEGSDTAVLGLGVGWDKMDVETHSRIHHRRPYCRTDHKHTCIATDRSRAIFTGRVQVEKEAQQTNAAQLTRSLLLSSKARVELVPQLEIRADDVKCTHGASCSDLDADELFYFQSRGIEPFAARRIMVRAFAARVVSEFPLESIKSRVLDRIEAAIASVADDRYDS